MIAAVAMMLFATAAGAGPATTQAATEGAWSKQSNGLRARLSLRRSSVSNGTAIVTTYLELSNVSDIGNPMLLKGTPIKFSVSDGDGRDVPVSGGAFDGMTPGTIELVLPHDSSMRYRIGPCGWGVPGDQAALLDLGPNYGWALPRDGKTYYVSGVMEVAEGKDERSERGTAWHGRIELPRVRIPTEAEPRDPKALGPVIEKLGAKMLAENESASEAAMGELSLIDDPRVVPWYVKAMKTDRYSLKFNALDRLARCDGEEALAGIKIGMATQGKDIGNCTTPALAADSANEIRHCAAIALDRSRHPQAKPLLWTMEHDPADAVRLTVIQSAAEMKTLESLELLKRATRDADEGVRDEAVRLLKDRESGKPAG
jgi:hypothetical protein